MNTSLTTSAPLTPWQNMQTMSAGHFLHGVTPPSDCQITSEEIAAKIDAESQLVCFHLARLISDTLFSRAIGWLSELCFGPKPEVARTLSVMTTGGLSDAVKSTCDKAGIVCNTWKTDFVVNRYSIGDDVVKNAPFSKVRLIAPMQRNSFVQNTQQPSWMFFHDSFARITRWNFPLYADKQEVLFVTNRFAPEEPVGERLGKSVLVTFSEPRFAATILADEITDAIVQLSAEGMKSKQIIPQLLARFPVPITIKVPNKPSQTFGSNIKDKIVSAKEIRDELVKVKNYLGSGCTVKAIEENIAQRNALILFDSIHNFHALSSDEVAELVKNVKSFSAKDLYRLRLGSDSLLHVALRAIVKTRTDFLYLSGTDYQSMNEKANTLVMAILRHWIDSRLPIDEENADCLTSLYFATFIRDTRYAEVLIKAGANKEVAEKRRESYDVAESYSEERHWRREREKHRVICGSPMHEDDESLVLSEQDLKTDTPKDTFLRRVIREALEKLDLEKLDNEEREKSS